MSIISNRKTGANTVELEIEVDAQKFRETAEQVFRRKVKSLTVPGFRKGKAPKQIVEKMYGEDIFLEDAISNLYPSAYEDSIKEADIEPVDKANIEIISADKEKGLVFKATVTVKPEIGIGKYKGLEAVKTIYAIEESSVDSEINKMRERNARIETMEDRPAKNGDIAVIDFEGFLDGVPFDGGKGENHELELGSGSFIKGFEEQITGHATGDEFDVNVAFPDEYHAEDLKGKPAVFKVKLHEIKEKQLPEPDDEFAKDCSEFDTIAELRESIRARLQEASDKRSASELETKLIDSVVEGVTGDIPEVMFEDKVDAMVQDFAYRLKSQRMSLELYLQYTGMDMESFRLEFREQAERHVKMRLAMEAIAAKENFDVSPEEIDAEYQKVADMYNIDIQKVRDFVSVKDVAADIACNKAIDLVKSSAVVTEAPEDKPQPDDGVKTELEG